MKTSKILKGSLMSSLLLAATAAHAQVPANQVQLGTPSYMGTGCPLGTVSAQLSPDAQALSIMFGSFQAIAGGFQWGSPWIVNNVILRFQFMSRRGSPSRS
jgi:hypothetical protein